MQVVKAEHTVFCDVDDTLVMHIPSSKIAPKDLVEVYDPVDKRVVRLRINQPMVRLLKEEYSRGSHIVVWSRGGNAWAESVVRALGLESYVHLVMTKPLVYFDDKDVADWLKYRVYLEPDTVYKVR